MMMHRFIRSRPIGPGYWFVRKRYGMGAMPANAKGWAAVFAYLLALGGTKLILHDRTAHIAAILSLTLIFGVVCWLKTEGGWGWKWGDD